jgi:hypothetical protein
MLHYDRHFANHLVRLQKLIWAYTEVYLYYNSSSHGIFHAIFNRIELGYNVMKGTEYYVSL